MVDSVLAVVALIAIGLLAAGVLNPVIAIILIVLAGGPLMVLLAGRLFKNAGATPSAAGTGPNVASTGEASYQPVTDPSDRG